MQVLTIGHSTRTLNEFIELLKDCNARVLVDVRRFPSSKKFPWFNSLELKKELLKHGINYYWFEVFGGFRKNVSGKIFPCKCLKSKGFQNYVVHMQSQEFLNGIKKFYKIIEKNETVLMCAEKFYWKCHRKLLSDFLTLNGVKVFHIIEKEKIVEHCLTKGVKLRNGLIFYE
jgi:uncharacterized protein (DUF488 family)